MLSHHHPMTDIASLEFLSSRVYELSHIIGKKKLRESGLRIFSATALRAARYSGLYRDARHGSEHASARSPESGHRLSTPAAAADRLDRSAPPRPHLQRRSQ